MILWFFLSILFIGLKAEAADPASVFLHNVELVHRQHGARLAELKGDLILGPILDVGDDAEGWNFSSSPCEVALLGDALRRGWEEGGHFIVAPKHFPGLGTRQVDTHDEIEVYATGPVSPDIVPFKYTIKNGAGAILMGHGLYPNFEKDPKDAVPAGFSSGVMGFLRDKNKGLGFEGIVIVDDVLMGAVTRFYAKKGENVSDIPSFSAARVVDAVRSGADMVMVFNWRENKRILEATVAAFERESKKDRTLGEKLDRSVDRILKAKKVSVPLKEMDITRKVSQVLFLWHSDDPMDDPVSEIGAYRFPTHGGRKIWFDKNRRETLADKKIIPTLVAVDQRKGYLPGRGNMLVMPSALGKEFKKILGNRDACSLIK